MYARLRVYRKLESALIFRPTTSLHFPVVCKYNPSKTSMTHTFLSSREKKNSLCTQKKRKKRKTTLTESIKIYNDQVPSDVLDCTITGYIFNDYTMSRYLTIGAVNLKVISSYIKL